MPVSDFWDRSADALLLLAYVASSIFALSIVGWQVIHWLRFDVWQQVPLSAGTAFIGIGLQWIYQPSSWLGLAKVARWVLDLPISLAAPFIVILMAHAWKAFVSSGTAPPTGPRIQ